MVSPRIDIWIDTPATTCVPPTVAPPPALPLVSSHLKVVPQDALRQSVEDLVVVAEHFSTLTPEAQRVDDARPQLPRQSVVPVSGEQNQDEV